MSPQSHVVFFCLSSLTDSFKIFPFQIHLFTLSFHLCPISSQHIYWYRFPFSDACCFLPDFYFFRALTTGRLSTTHRTISSEFQLVFQDFADLIFLRIHLHLLIFLRRYLLKSLGTLYTCTSAARETRRFMGLNQDSRSVLFSLKHNQEYLMTALIKSGKARI